MKADEISTIRGRYTFTGKSTDDKPGVAPQGATYLSVDTGERWVFNEEMWVFDITSKLLTQSLY